MALIKHPYEISIWTEKLNEDGIKEEKMGAIIGAHDMTYLGKATNVKFKREVKGTNTLTFDMPSKFFDSAKGEYVHNDLVDAIKNETKVKLHYKDKWYDFFIKKITENKKFKAIMYSYSCSDCFIDELSRTGYEIQFDDRLNNSVNEIGIFMEDILEQSIWDYTPEYNIGDFTEFNEQRFYKIPVSQFGGTIHGYKLNLEVQPDDFLLNGEPKTYLQEKLNEQGLIWAEMTDAERYDFIEELMTVTNILTNTDRELEYGDDLARERELFWDCYYKDNGSKLLSEDNKFEINEEYIYVPITDLSMIMGSVYEDAYKAIEEPALYGSYTDENSLGYALQPTNKNPRGLIQFLALSEGNIYHIDEEGVLADNDYHYVIPIEEWNDLLASTLSSDGGLIYWTSPLSTTLEKSKKYTIAEDTINNYAYTTDARPNSSVIDDFTWYPVYYEGYLAFINDTEVAMARKISVTDRTEYNKAADMFVTVYNNKANEYLDNKDTLYSEKELAEKVKEGQEFRVCSNLQTRQILPILARNLIQNGTEITDVNGWEAKTQNNNGEESTGTGSYKSLMTLEVLPTLQRDADGETVETFNFEGTKADETVSDYYLKVLSPKLNKCIDFSKEGDIEFDYVLNFGLISQDYSIEKDKIYAMRLKTGNMVTTKVTFDYRSNEDSQSFTENIDEIVNDYTDTMDRYYLLISSFGRDKESNKEALHSLFEGSAVTTAILDHYVDLFYSMIAALSTGEESSLSKLRKTVDKALAVLLFGGEWNFNNATQESLQGLIPLYDSNKNHIYEKFNSLAIGPTENDTSVSYKNSDTNYLKYYLYNKIPTTPEKEFSSLSALTKAFENSWKTTYIKYDKIFDNRINEDLDKIIIGKGSLNNDGNYIIEGIDKGDEYISFSKVFDIQNALYFVPNDTETYSNTNKELLTKPLYHNKINTTKKCWKYGDKISGVSIEDNVYLLFKANQTITKPYIGIKVESAPMKINFDSVEKTVYKESISSGVVFNMRNEDHQYINGVSIELIKIDKTSVSDAFKQRIGFDNKKGTFDTTITSFNFDREEDLETSHISWSGISSDENPLIDSSFLLNIDESATFPYLVFINGECKGLIYLTERGE